MNPVRSTGQVISVTCTGFSRGGAWLGTGKSRSRSLLGRVPAAAAAAGRAARERGIPVFLLRKWRAPGAPRQRRRRFLWRGEMAAPGAPVTVTVTYSKRQGQRAGGAAPAAGPLPALPRPSARHPGPARSGTGHCGRAGPAAPAVGAGGGGLGGARPGPLSPRSVPAVPWGFAPYWARLARVSSSRSAGVGVLRGGWGEQVTRRPSQRSAGGDEDLGGTGASLLKGRGEGAGPVQPRGEMTEGTSLMWMNIWRGMPRRWSQAVLSDAQQ